MWTGYTGAFRWTQVGRTESEAHQKAYVNSRRKFSQTSDNMDRWKAERGRGREKRKIRREKSRRERVRRKKMEMREKVGKSRFTVIFQWIVAPEGRKVGSLKRRVRSQLARWEMKKCTPLWREAHFQVKMLKTLGVRTTFGSWDVEKVHAVVARSTFPSQNVQNTPFSDHFWKLQCRKSARRCGAKQISKSKCTKHTRCRPLLEVEMSKKCTPLWREAHFEVKMCKTHHVRTTFGSWDVEKVHAVVARSTFKSQNVQSTPCTDHFWSFRCRFAWHAQGIVYLVKSDQTWGFCNISKSDGRRGTCEEDLQRCIFRGRCSTKGMFMRDVRRSGRWFPERGCILEHQICRFPKMILRDRCSTSYDLASIFRGRRSTFDRWTRKIAQRIGTRPSALHSIFHFWRKSRRIASFWMFSSLKFEEVLQNCFVLDVVNIEKWRSLADLLRFWCCQLWKMRRSRRIATFLMSSTLKNEEVSQNSSVFKLADRQVDR